jgi:hypothetical protein
LPEVQEALAADVITVAHALLLTRVPQAQQAKTCEQCFHALCEGRTRENLAPLRQLKQWIDTKTQLDVRGADAQVLLPVDYVSTVTITPGAITSKLPLSKSTLIDPSDVE